MNKEFTKHEIGLLATYLRNHPIDEMWKPVDYDWCKVQRVPSDSMCGRCNLIKKHDDKMDLYQIETNGIVYIQLDRKENTPWYVESGVTYMCFK